MVYPEVHDEIEADSIVRMVVESVVDSIRFGIAPIKRFRKMAGDPRLSLELAQQYVQLGGDPVPWQSLGIRPIEFGDVMVAILLDRLDELEAGEEA